ncbi:hypothetical protein N9098_00695, partial [bacterium]|nr:hypothetical protein [bacterium]
KQQQARSRFITENDGSIATVQSTSSKGSGRKQTAVIAANRKKAALRESNTFRHMAWHSTDALRDD